MRRTIVAALAVLIFLPALRAQDEKDKDKPKPDEAASPREQFGNLQREYLAKQMEIAQTQVRLVETYALKFLQFAEKDSKDPAALDALLWVMTNAGHTRSAVVSRS